MFRDGATHAGNTWHPWHPCGTHGVLLRVPGKEFVDESDRHAAFTDRGSDAFDWAQPHIPTGESTGNTCLEEVGIAAERPTSDLYHVVSGEDTLGCHTSHWRIVACS
jgi:hypothetical protein